MKNKRDPVLFDDVAILKHVKCKFAWKKLLVKDNILMKLVLRYRLRTKLDHQAGPFNRLYNCTCKVTEINAQNRIKINLIFKLLHCIG